MYIPGVKMTRARSGRPGGGVDGGDQALPSSLNITAPPTPTARKRVPSAPPFVTLRRLGALGGAVGLQATPSVLVKIVPASPTAT